MRGLTSVPLTVFPLPPLGNALLNEDLGSALLRFLSFTSLSGPADIRNYWDFVSSFQRLVNRLVLSAFTMDNESSTLETWIKLCESTKLTQTDEILFDGTKYYGLLIDKGKTDEELLCEIKESGYVKFQLPSQLSEAIKQVVQVMDFRVFQVGFSIWLLFQLGDEAKSQLKKDYNDNQHTKNLFGYSKRPNFSKEFWKV